MMMMKMTLMMIKMMMMVTMMIDGSQVAALQVVDSAWSFQHNLATNHGQGQDLLGPVRNTNWVETRLSWVTTSQQNPFTLASSAKSYKNDRLDDQQSLVWVCTSAEGSMMTVRWGHKNFQDRLIEQKKRQAGKRGAHIGEHTGSMKKCPKEYEEKG